MSIEDVTRASVETMSWRSGHSRGRVRSGASRRGRSRRRAGVGPRGGRLSSVVLVAALVGVAGVTTASDSALTSADARAYAMFPAAFGALAASRLPSDDSGLIGRNRVWGELFSPRFQLGAGEALRTALVAARPAEAARAFRAIEVGASSAREDGYLPSRLPPRVGGPPSDADVASAAAFFLGDACLALRALDRPGGSEAVASLARRRASEEHLARATRWLLERRALLSRIDAPAPNRLLFDALAFRACATFLDADTARRAESAATAFVDEALALQGEDGHFAEGGGHDTSYQGVALRVGEDLLLAGANDDRRLADALGSAARWLADRVDAEGRIDSSGNARTCWSGELVFGERKRVAVPDVFAGLAYAAVRTREPALRDAATRIARWARERRGADPCFRGRGSASASASERPPAER